MKQLYAHGFELTGAPLAIVMGLIIISAICLVIGCISYRHNKKESGNYDHWSDEKR